MDVDVTRAEKIAELNDKFRRLGINMMATPGVREVEDFSLLVNAVRQFNGFGEDNDPYQEHDFGSFDWHSTRIFWKVDYYDRNLEYWCDPLSPECRRVITIMLASEY